MAVDRISAAQSRVRAVKAELQSPARYFPCIQCRYYEFVCTHPAVSKIGMDPVSGTASVDYLAAEKARAEDGACGPEGALFDARSLPGQVAVLILSKAWGRWGLFIAGAVALDMLLR